ncbi:hypothetical protein Y032_0094g2686 [Ancylostoma ceylanicum]|uniref:Uncharacterized protein n=1 Tax=Ancylostoma ceylanicum TaxID=53326 RepID=A0A016TKY8_9BILA|nr:hypothetical protein Y032_0094g2686 [Ancylostoma ceylanicum]
MRIRFTVAGSSRCWRRRPPRRPAHNRSASALQSPATAMQGATVLTRTIAAVVLPFAIVQMMQSVEEYDGKVKEFRIGKVLLAS